MSRKIRVIAGLLVLILLGVAGICRAATVSGTITNGATTGGRVYIMLQNEQQPWVTGLGTSVVIGGSGTASYTVQGVPDGTWRIKAFLDTRNNGYPFGGSLIGGTDQFEVKASDLTGKDFSLWPQQPPALSAPQGLHAAPINNGAMIMWEPQRDQQYDIEIAEKYNIYWSTTANPGPSNTAGGGSKLNLTSHNDGHVFIPLANGGSYYFAVEAVFGQSKAISRTATPITIGSPAGGSTVTAQINFTSAPQADAPFLAVLMAQDSFGGGTMINSPVQNQQITINGVPNGSYSLYLILDKNQNGMYDTGDVSYTGQEWKQPRVEVNNAGVDLGPLSMSPARNMESSLRTQTQNIGQSASFNLNFGFKSQLKRPAHIVISGPQISPVSVTTNSWGDFRWQQWLQNAPVAGDQYTAAVTYTDGTTENTPLTVTPYITSFAQQTWPRENVFLGTNNPLLAWNTLRGIPSTPFIYRVKLVPSNYNGEYWFDKYVGPDQNSVRYTGENQLQTGTQYVWGVEMIDSNGNGAETWYYFTPQASGPAITSFNPSTVACSNTAGTPVTITGSGFNTDRFQNQVYINTTNSAITPDSATATSLTFTMPPCSQVLSPAGPLMVRNSETIVFGASTTEFTPTLTFNGKVNDWNGNLLDGVTVTVADNPAVTAVQSANGGLYSLAGIPTGKQYRQKLSKAGLVPVYTAYIMHYSDVPNTNVNPYSLAPAANMTTWGIQAGKGIIRSRTRDNTGSNLNGVTVSAYSARYQSSSIYEVKYGDCSSSTVLANDSRYCVMNVEPGDLIRVTGTKEGYTFSV